MSRPLHLWHGAAERGRRRLAILLAAAGLAGCAESALQIAAAEPAPAVEPLQAPAPPQAPAGPAAPRRQALVGLASWYGPYHPGRRTANGERFDAERMTAAHRTLPFGTWVEVMDRTTGRSVVVRITDRGPASHNRLIDLSRGAARRLGILRAGLAEVALTVVAPPILPPPSLVAAGR